MDIRLRFLTAEIAILTAIASLFVTDTEQWTKVYERRLYAEMALNLWRSNESKTGEEILPGLDPIPARTPGVEEAPLVWAEEVVNESQTSEEAPAAQQTRQEKVVEAVSESSPAPAETLPPEEPPAVYQASAPLYLVEGEQLDPGVAEYLYRRLCETGIGWFYEYALCLAYQESSFNPLAENVNGRDKGLYQFRVEFHPGLAWQNPYAQTDLFVSMMAARAVAGCDVYSMISRHNTSDYCPEINPAYLTQVLSHLPTLQRIR